MPRQEERGEWEAGRQGHRRATPGLLDRTMYTHRSHQVFGGGDKSKCGPFTNVQRGRGGEIIRALVGLGGGEARPAVHAARSAPML
jgi:hypothetical protein